MFLQIENKELGGLWIGYIKKIEQNANNLVNSDLELVSAIGVKDEFSVVQPRLSIDEIVTYK